MSVGIFTDKAHPPSVGDILTAVGPWRAAWEDLAQFIRDSFSTREELRFYGKNYGWALRFRKSGKALVSLYPAPGSFTIQIILGEADAQKALTLRLGEHVRQVIADAHPYPEGRWVFVSVESEQDIQDMREVLALKGTTSRQRKQNRSDT